MVVLLLILQYLDDCVKAVIRMVPPPNHQQESSCLDHLRGVHVHSGRRRRFLPCYIAAVPSHLALLGQDGLGSLHQHGHYHRTGISVQRFQRCYRFNVCHIARIRCLASKSPEAGEIGPDYSHHNGMRVSDTTHPRKKGSELTNTIVQVQQWLSGCRFSNSSVTLIFFVSSTAYQVNDCQTNLCKGQRLTLPFGPRLR